MAVKRPGKYEAVMHKLPKLNKVPFQDRVEIEKTAQCKCERCEGTGKFSTHSFQDTDNTFIRCDTCNGTGKVKPTALTMATRYVKLRVEREAAEALVSRLYLQLEALSQMLIVSQEQGEPEWGAYGAAENAIRLTDGGGIRLQPEIYPVIEDKQKFLGWCVGEQIAPALANTPFGSKLELPVKPLTDMVKDRLLRAMPEPDGVKVFVKTKVIYSAVVTETVPADAADAENF